MFVGAKHFSGQCTRQLGLSYSSWTKEEKDTSRTIARLQTSTSHLDGLCNTVDGFILTNDSPLKKSFQIKQTIPFLASRCKYRNAATMRDHFCDHRRGNHRLLDNLIFII